jgi:hypothetical protein
METAHWKRADADFLRKTTRRAVRPRDLRLGETWVNRVLYSETSGNIIIAGAYLCWTQKPAVLRIRGHMTKAIWTKPLSIISGALACFCLYVGPTTLLFLPPGNGEHSYWDWSRVVYGVLPTILSAGLIVLAGWLWSRGIGHASLGEYISYAFSAVVGGLVLFWIVLIIIAHLLGRIP